MSELTTLLHMVEKNEKVLADKHPEFSRRVRAAMEESDVSTTDIATKLKISYEMARRYTLGHAMPRAGKMLALAKLLKVEAAYLQYGGDDDQAAPINPINSDLVNLSDLIEIAQMYQQADDEARIRLVKFARALQKKRKNKISHAA